VWREREVSRMKGRDWWRLGGEEEEEVAVDKQPNRVASSTHPETPHTAVLVDGAHTSVFFTQK
jgi:hypothetical protein